MAALISLLRGISKTHLEEDNNEALNLKSIFQKLLHNEPQGQGLILAQGHRTPYPVTRSEKNKSNNNSTGVPRDVPRCSATEIE
jgi:hypothetical protein